MNKVLQKKLLSYSTLATALLAIDRSADAQIIYTSPSPPDSIILNIVPRTFFQKGSTQFCTGYLDLNNDGISDFKFTVFFSSSYYSTYFSYGYEKEKALVTIAGIGNNKVDGDTAESNGQLICSSKNWKSSQLLALYTRFYGSVASGGGGVKYIGGSFQSGAFRGGKDAYLPAKLNLNGDNYLGWIRLTIVNWADEIIVRSYAYDATPNECITTGDTLAVTTPVLSSPIANGTFVWSSSKHVYVKLSNDNLLNSTVTIYNTCGQQVYSSQLATSQTDIELSNIPSGLYIVHINREQSSIIKKIILD